MQESPDTFLNQRRIEHGEALERALAKIVNHLSNIPEVKLIILFGSYTTGRRDLFTDLDLVVVMSSELDFVTRTAELYREITVEVDLDMLVYTPEEFERQRQKGFIRRALEKGQVLYEKKRS